jgi:S1-C subfamily serine protease
MSNLLFSCDFDINKAIESIVTINSYIPDNSFSSELLGTERSGHAVVIDDEGLLLTIGYIITEAEYIWITVQGNDPVPGYIVGNDYESGLGLVKPIKPINLPKIEIGSLSNLNAGDKVVLADSAGTSHLINSSVLSIKEFAGRWEYLLDNAIYTSPVHDNWAGSALIGQDGLLYGIGCLLIQDVESENKINSYNMYVPTDTILPYINEIKEFGGRKKSPRPWLGMLVNAEDTELVITGIFTACPADKAGLQLGDIITHVNQDPVTTLRELFMGIWKIGDSGVEVTISLIRDDKEYNVDVISSDRDSSFIRGTVN